MSKKDEFEKALNILNMTDTIDVCAVCQQGKMCTDHTAIINMIVNTLKEERQRTAKAMLKDIEEFEDDSIKSNDIYKHRAFEPQIVIRISDMQRCDLNQEVKK